MSILANWAGKNFQEEEKKISEKYKNDLSQSLITNDGTNYGKITRKGLKAIQNNSLSNYTPANKEEENTINSFKNSLITLKGSDGKEYSIKYGDYEFFSNALAGKLGDEWSPIVYGTGHEKQGQISGYYNKKRPEQSYKLGDNNSILRLGKMTGKISPESVQVLNDYNTNESRIAFIKNNNLQGFEEKYGIDIYEFGEKEWRKLAEKHGWREIEHSGGDGESFVSFECPENIGAKNPYNVKLSQTTKDIIKLKTLAENNDRRDSSTKDYGALYAAGIGLGNGITFGIGDYLADKIAEKKYKNSGLDSDYYISHSDAMATTLNNHKIAYGAGSIGGTIATSLGLGGLVKGGLKVAGVTIGKKWAEAAVIQGTVGAIRGGVTTATSGGDWKDIGIATLREGLTGAVSGAAGAKIEGAISNVLTNPKYANTVLNGIKDMRLTAYGAQAISGLGEAIVDWKTDREFVRLSNNLFGTDLEQRTGTDLLTDFAVTMVFGFGNKLNTDGSVDLPNKVKDFDVYINDYDTYKTLMKSDADVNAKIKAGEDLIARGNELKQFVDENIFTGQKDTVDLIKNGVDTVNEVVKTNNESFKKVEVKTTPTTETGVAPTKKPTNITPVSTEGGVIKNVTKPDDNIINSKTPELDVEGRTAETKKSIPTYDEYKAEVEKRYPGIDENLIKERYKGYYSADKTTPKNIKVEVTAKVPADLAKTVEAVKVRSGLDIVFGNRYIDGELDTSFQGMIDGKKIIVSENATKKDVFNAVVLHELTHGIQGTSKYKDIYDFVVKEMYGSADSKAFKEDAQNKISEYKKSGKDLTEPEAKAEIVASNIQKYIFEDDAGSIVGKNYTLGQKIYDVITELIYNVKKKFGNTFELDELAAMQRKYRLALDEVKRNGVKTADGEYSIETIPGTNKKYVKFGRDLELGKTKEEWSANIEKYIKDNITKNGSITIVTEDGDSIVINGRTAWKIADVQKTKDGVKVPMSDSELRVKYEAGAHIDELVEISKRGNKTEPDDGSHDWANEWNYRTAFFEDSKGDKYRMRISVGINPKEAAAYNVGSIQKRGDLRDGPSSAIADGGALNGDAPRGIVYHDKSQLSSENKTEMQLAYEKALAKNNGNEQYSFATQNDIDGALADFEAHYGEMYRGNVSQGEIPNALENGTVKMSDTEFGNLLNKRAITKAEGETLANEIFKRFGKKEPAERVETVATQLASPIYDGMDAGRLNDASSVLVGNEQALYQTKKEMRKIKDALQPTEKQLAYIDKIARGEADIDDFSSSLELEKFQDLIDIKRDISNLENDGIKGFRERSRANFRDKISGLIERSENWKDKMAKMLWDKSTPERNAFDTMGEDAQEFINTFIAPTKENAANKTRYINELKQKILDMKLSDADFEAVQRYGEGLIRTASFKVVNAHKVFNEIAEKIKNDVNSVLVLNGYKPIDNPKIHLDAYEFKQAIKVLNGELDYESINSDKIRQFINIAQRNGIDSVNYDTRGKVTGTVSIPYYPHGENLTALQKAKKAMGFSQEVTELPGEITGITSEFKPNKKWVPNLLERKSKHTDYSLKNWDNYIDNISEVIFHTGDITKLRIFEAGLRSKYSPGQWDDEIRYALDNMSNEELAEWLPTLSERKNELSKHNNLINWVNEYTNILAGKKHSLDRGFESAIGRKFYNLMDTASNNWTLNQVAYNASTWVNQFKQATNIISENNPIDVVTGFVSNLFNKTPLNESDFIVTREGNLRLKESAISKMAFAVPQKIDSVMTNWAYRTKYNEMIRKGSSGADAKKAADMYASQVMGDRSKAGRPTIFGARNPIVRLFTTFQIENINSWEHLLKDIPREKGLATTFKTVVAMALANHLFNEGKEKLTGTQGIGFDPIEMGWETYKYFAKEEGVDLESLKETYIENIARLPFAQTALVATGMEDVDRLPVAGVFKNIFTGRPEDVISLVNPYGGYNQARKTIQGIKTVNEGRATDKNGNLMYPVNQSGANYVKGTVFGKYSLPESQEYWDNNRRALTENETNEYNHRVERGENPQSVYDDIYGQKEERSRLKKESETYYNKVDSLVNPVSEDVVYNIDEIYNSYSVEYAERHDGEKPSTISVPEATKEFKRNSKTYILTEEQCAELQNKYNKLYEDRVEKILNNKNLTAKQKYNQIMEKRKVIKNTAESQFFTKYAGKLQKK